MISFLSLTETDVLLSVLDRQWCTPFCHAGFGFRQTLMFLFLSLTDTDVLLSVLDRHKFFPFLSWTTLIFSLLSLTHTDVLLSVLDGHRCSSFCPWQTQLFSCLSLADTDALFSAILWLATDIDVFFLSLARHWCFLLSLTDTDVLHLSLCDWLPTDTDVLLSVFYSSTLILSSVIKWLATERCSYPLFCH